MDLRQGGRFVHDYSKFFNHLSQYAPEQVDIDSKKKASFLRGLSTKLRERLLLSTGGSFPKFLSNAIIADNTIHAHKEGKKRKAMAASSNSANPKYQMVSAPHSNYQPIHCSSTNIGHPDHHHASM
jgi:hypothetical protein